MAFPKSMLLLALFALIAAVSLQSFSMRVLGLKKVTLEMHKFSQPNLEVPESIRGVWYFDLDTDLVSVDLNLISKKHNANDHCYAQDTLSGYQSVKPTFGGICLFAFAHFLQIRSDIEVKNMTVTWSLFRGLISLPFESPSEFSDNDEHELKRVVKFKFSEMNDYLLKSYRALRVVDQHGERTKHWNEMIEKHGNEVYVKT